MKKYQLNFTVLVFAALLLSSCYSPKFMVDDDVYLVKNSALPVGESLSDESSYASYRNTREAEGISRHYYDDDFFFWRQRRPFFGTHWMLSMGYYNPYFMTNPYGSFSHFGTPYYSPYMFGGINPIYMVDPFGSPYGFYPTAYNFAYMGGMYSPFYGGFNPNGGLNNGGNYSVNYNHHSGPRGTVSGFGNPNSRTNVGNVIKSVGSSGTNINGRQFKTQQKLDRSANIGNNLRNETNLKPNRTSIQSTPVRYSPTTDKANRPSGRINVGVSESPRTTPNSQMRNSNNRTSPNQIPGGRQGGEIRPSNTGGGGSNGPGRSGGSPTGGGNRRN
jgi:hypothetical protein